MSNIIDFESFSDLMVTVLGTSESIQTNTDVARDVWGANVRGTNVWDGPVPDGSFLPTTNPFVTMASPEYLFLRKANQLGLFDAIEVGCVLLSHYSTSITSPSLAPNEVERMDYTHTTYERLKAYLDQIDDTPEGRRALMVLCLANDSAKAYEHLLDRMYEAQLD